MANLGICQLGSARLPAKQAKVRHQEFLLWGLGKPGNPSGPSGGEGPGERRLQPPVQLRLLLHTAPKARRASWLCSRSGFTRGSLDHPRMEWRFHADSQLSRPFLRCSSFVVLALKCSAGVERALRVADLS